MKRQVPNQVLTNAVADAADGKRVVVLVDDVNDIDRVVEHARRFTTELVRESMGSQHANKMFAASENRWILALARGGGWVFFFPVEITTADEDINAPDFVYWQDPKGVYERLAYHEWVLQRRAGNVWRPRRVGVGDAPRTAWDHILDDELDA
jgi:hypothetical protein